MKIHLDVERYVWVYFNEWRVEGYLKAYFPEKIRLIANTYPGTQYGCTAMDNKKRTSGKPIDFCSSIYQLAYQ
ncbi:hypothetical protein Q1695_016316 [Nippostrongylus brasiliensis]|nr:hypothetical protein Q1695_016316 [Nippostrongylus brasiliensis]